jgi:glycosyltransferase involved in cell wall biosynthesis
MSQISNDSQEKTTETKVRVLAVTSGYQRSKEDIAYVHDFVTEQVRRLGSNFEMMVLAPRDSGNEVDEVIDGVRVFRHNQSPFNLVTIAYGSGAVPNIRANPFKILVLPFYMAYLTAKLIRIIRSQKVRCVHLHWLIPHGLVAALYKKFIDPKLTLIGTAYGADILQDQFSVGGKLMNRVIKFVASQCTMVITCSGNNRKILEPIVSRNDVVLIPVGVDTDFYRPDRRSEKKRNELGIKGAAVLFVGSLIERKGVDKLVEAIPAILEKNPNMQFNFIGRGYLEIRLKDFVQTNNLNDKARFLGFVDNETKADYFANCDFFCLPSNSEGFGIVNVEAMSSGCIPIVSDLAVFKDVVMDGKLGYVLKDSMPESFTEIFGDIFSEDAGKLAALRVACRQHAITNYSWPKTTHIYSESFNEALRQTNNEK